MTTKKQFLKSMTVAFAAMSALSASNALAKEAKMEKCYGIVKAGKNDCASAKAGSHSCAGAATVNGDKNEWILLPEGACDRIVGGSTKAGK